MKLKQASLSKIDLASGKTDEILFDDELPRFGLRIRAGGSRKWIIQYRQGGIKRRYTIGPAATLTLDEARRKARRLLVDIDEGKNPVAERETKRAASALLFSAVAADYLKAREPHMRPRTYKESSRHIALHWKPLHNLPLTNINRPVVAAHLRKIAELNGAVAANRARSTLSALFAWAIGEGIADENPVMGTNKAAEGPPRDRLLTDIELAKIWKAAPDNKYGCIVRLLMLTGQRREEIGALRWSEIDLDAKLITLAGERVKNGRAHEIPLAPAALGILEAQPHLKGRDVLFGEGEGGFSGWSKAKEALDRTAKVKGWTVHDLRRTAATRMADLGVAPHVIEAVLNHISGHKSGVAGIYNRSTYSTEKRAALELWANHLMVEVAKADGANVHRLKRGRHG